MPTVTPGPFGLEARVLYRDDAVIVIDKPAGIPVHKGPKGGSVLEDGFRALRFGFEQNPHLAHRLDRETSGCLVLGRTRAAAAALGRLFARGAVDKLYWAVVEGGPDGDGGVIDAPLARRDPGRGWWMKVDAAGRPARTAWHVLGRGPAIAWLALTPMTGRTHQLRLHCAHAGFPIRGDAIYGRAPRGDALHLHARRIGFALEGRRIEAEAPVPGHMQAALAACGWH